ncbi:DUF429 domain-containing protein [Williamsia sp. MIQD14]|uniref:DUF429 domain-containing protein n=1 Tax=Williamsia sp. MIQD14 TaxID=3425703 RepID=UPI003D9FF57A
MRTVGVDLAAEPAKTACAVVEWAAGRAEVTALRLGADDAVLVAAADGADRVGVDAPFGWPDAFVEFVVAHHHGGAPTTGPLNTRAARGPLVRRHTDEVVRVETGLIPLSVSADLIAHVALRCSSVLRALDVSDRVHGTAAEVYPAAALRTWGLRSRGYKGSANTGVRATLLADLAVAAPWLELGDFAPLCHASDDAVDAVVAALLARAVALGATLLPSAEMADVAAREGWIHLPRIDLSELVTG